MQRTHLINVSLSITGSKPKLPGINVFLVVDLQHVNNFLTYAFQEFSRDDLGLLKMTCWLRNSVVK